MAKKKSAIKADEATADAADDAADTAAQPTEAPPVEVVVKATNKPPGWYVQVAGKLVGNPHAYEMAAIRASLPIIRAGADPTTVQVVEVPKA